MDEVALYSPHWRRFLHITDGAHLGVTAEMNGHGIPDAWTWERFTVACRFLVEVGYESLH